MTNMMSNKITLIGKLENIVELFYNVPNEKFSRGFLSVFREKEHVDVIPIAMEKSRMEEYKGHNVKVTGNVTSYDASRPNGNVYREIYILVEEIEVVDKQPEYPKREFEFERAFIKEISRPYNVTEKNTRKLVISFDNVQFKKKDDVPCYTRGEDSNLVDTLPLGSYISAIGCVHNWMGFCQLFIKKLKVVR